jgi:hypothetical protein
MWAIRGPESKEKIVVGFVLALSLASLDPVDEAILTGDGGR